MNKVICNLVDPCYMQRVCADSVLVGVSCPAVCPYMKGPLSDSDDDEDVSLFGKSTASVTHAKYANLQ